MSDVQTQDIMAEIEADRNTYYYDNSSGIKFKKYMINAIEAIIRQEVPTERGGNVADINFAYHNSQLLDALRTRGQYIINQEWSNLNRANREITQLIQD